MSTHSILKTLSFGVLCMAATPAGAAVLYNLDNIQFVDGGSVQGWFSLSDDLKSLQDYSFQIPTSGTGLGIFAASNYQPDIGSSSFKFSPVGQIVVDNRFYRLTLNFADVFGDSPNELLSGTLTSVRPVKPGHISLRTLSSGNAVPAVPEPSTWALMLLGFGVTGAMIRRKRAGKRMVIQPA